MQTILMAGNDNKKIKEYLANLFKQKSIDPLDVTVVDFNIDAKGAKKLSIGIAEIREFQKKVSLMPIKSPTKAVIFQNADSLTHTAQNALLKTLEEPPDNTIIILSAVDTSVFLATVLSRCFVLYFNKVHAKKGQLESMPNFSSIGEMLFYAQEKGKDKKTALNFLSDELENTHKQFIENEVIDGTTAQKLSLLQTTYSQIKSTNVNPQMALEIVLLKLFT